MLGVSKKASRCQDQSKQKGRIPPNMCMRNLNHENSCHKISQMLKVYRGNQASLLRTNQLGLLNPQKTCQEFSDLQMAESLQEG